MFSHRPIAAALALLSVGVSGCKKEENLAKVEVNVPAAPKLVIDKSIQSAFDSLPSTSRNVFHPDSTDAEIRGKFLEFLKKDPLQQAAFAKALVAKENDGIPFDDWKILACSSAKEEIPGFQDLMRSCLVTQEAYDAIAGADKRDPQQSWHEDYSKLKYAKTLIALIVENGTTNSELTEMISNLTNPDLEKSKSLYLNKFCPVKDLANFEKIVELQRGEKSSHSRLAYLSPEDAKILVSTLIAPENNIYTIESPSRDGLMILRGLCSVDSDSSHIRNIVKSDFQEPLLSYISKFADLDLKSLITMNENERSTVSRYAVLAFDILQDAKVKTPELTELAGKVHALTSSDEFKQWESQSRRLFVGIVHEKACQYLGIKHD